MFRPILGIILGYFKTDQVFLCKCWRSEWNVCVRERAKMTNGGSRARALNNIRMKEAVSAHKSINYDLLM